MFIQTEDTPNPAAMKFIPGLPVLSGGSMEFRDAAAASTFSPLATRLFELSGVIGVFLGADFITVSKDSRTDWRPLRAEVLAVLMDHFTRQLPIVHQGAAINVAVQKGEPDEIDAVDTPVVAQIKELLDARVRPAVAQDGGDITFVSFDDGIVHLRLQGSCAGCPSSTATLKSGVENMLKHYIPEIIEVRAVRD